MKRVWNMSKEFWSDHEARGPFFSFCKRSIDQKKGLETSLKRSS